MIKLQPSPTAHDCAGQQSGFDGQETTGASTVGLRAQAQPPGTEVSDAETGRPKSLQNARTLAETKIRELSGRKPRGNALFGVAPETHGLQGLDGGGIRARTWDPLIKRHPPRL